MNLAHADDQKIEALLSRRKFSEAESLINLKLQKDPESADAHYLSGVCHYFQGHVGETIQELRRALEIDPRHTDAAICLSVLFNDIGKYDDAKKVFEQANQSIVHERRALEIGIDRKFAIKHQELADLYFRYKRFDEAIEEYSKAAILDPTTLEIRIRRAKAFAKKGFITRAIQELQQLKTENPHFVTARIQLGLLHYSQNNILDAELEWEHVLEIDPVHSEAKTYLEMARKVRTTPEDSSR